MKYFTWGIFLCCLFACQPIHRDKMISERLIKRLKDLHLLDDNETIFQFYSNYRKRIAGNFVSDKRVATYYIDDRSQSRDEIAFAYYENIRTMDTLYRSVQVSAPHLLVTTFDRKLIKVYVDGDRATVQSFFDKALEQWALHRKQGVSPSIKM
ncbi:hypothetical protein [Chitinophaga sancti]|uniref:DUF4296 domain-containing protein n=1 Tax=Chitinophaga sancti TaxID=1004 RepID=A0ABZ0XNI0_9BACT|nr:hypothetical protein [Chitinophaga sancti]WQG91764.1 hypothetical protein SR876_09625 [Chitinophaga sancti]